MSKIPIVFDKERNVLTVANQPVVLHCNHYNMFLQQSIEDLLGEERARVLQISAAMRTIARVFDNIDLQGMKGEDILALGSDLFRKLGYGLIDFSEVSPTGGRVFLPFSHYAFNWFAKFGPAKNGVCLFAMGFALATINRAFGTSFDVSSIKEVECRGMDPEKHEQCILEVK